MEQQQQDTFYVTPSLQNVILTEKGKLIDIVLSKDIGIWELSSGKCLKVLSNIASESINTLYPFKSSNPGEQTDEYFLLAGEKSLKVFDIIQDKVQVEISFGSNFNLQDVKNQGKKLVLVGQEKILFYPDIFKAPTQFIELGTEQFVQVVENQENYEQEKFRINKAVLLETGNFVFYSKYAEGVYMTSFSEEELESGNYTSQPKTKNIFSNGIITGMISLSGSQIAIAHEQSVHIIDTERNCIKDMLKGYNDGYISLIYLKEKNQIVTGSSKAIIRLWDLKKCRSLAKFGNEFDIEYHQLFAHNNQLVSVNNEIRRLKVWAIEKPKEIRPLKFMQGGLKSVQKVVKIDQQTVAMLTTRGEFSLGQMNFKQYIEVVNILTNEHYLDQIVEENGYQLDLNSFMFSQQHQNSVFYLMKSEDITKSDKLHFQQYQNEQKLSKIEFNVEEHKKAYFFKFGRIIIPYNLSFDPSQIFGLSMGGMGKISGNSGISVYDFNVKLKQSIKFEEEFVVEVLEMIDESNMMFLNKQNKLEFWNIDKQQQTQVVECHPNVFKQIKHINEYIFLLSHNKEEFVLWDATDLDMIQRRKAKKDMKKIELFDENCIILYSSGQLELWDVETGEYRDSKIPYKVSDFIVQGNTILLVGEGFMQITSRGKL